MLKFVVLLSKSVDESGHLALIVSRDGILLLFNSLCNLRVELLFLAFNHRLKMFEHPIHLFREVLQIILRLLLAVVHFLLVVLDVLPEFINLLETSSDHNLLRLKGVQSHGVYAKHLGKVAKLVIAECVAPATSLSRGLLLLEKFRDALFAERSVETINDGLREMDLA